MDLAQEFRDQIRSYIEGGCSLGELREWLVLHTQGIADGGDTELNELDGRAWILVSEYDYGHRDEQGLRSELRRLLADAAAEFAFTPEHAVARTGIADGTASTQWLTFHAELIPQSQPARRGFAAVL
jgi:hypothetical protein